MSTCVQVHVGTRVYECVWRGSECGLCVCMSQRSTTVCMSKCLCVGEWVLMCVCVYESGANHSDISPDFILQVTIFTVWSSAAWLGLSPHQHTRVTSTCLNAMLSEMGYQDWTEVSTSTLWTKLSPQPFKMAIFLIRENVKLLFCVHPERKGTVVNRVQVVDFQFGGSFVLYLEWPLMLLSCSSLRLKLTVSWMNPSQMCPVLKSCHLTPNHFHVMLESTWQNLEAPGRWISGMTMWYHLDCIHWGRPTHCEWYHFLTGILDCECRKGAEQQCTQQCNNSLLPAWRGCVIALICCALAPCFSLCCLCISVSLCLSLSLFHWFWQSVLITVTRKEIKTAHCSVCEVPGSISDAPPSWWRYSVSQHTNTLLSRKTCFLLSGYGI